MNPFPNSPYVTDLGDGLRMTETRDRGKCYRVLEPTGNVSVVIQVNNPPPPKASEDPFCVRHTSSGQEIVDDEGNVIAQTTDEAKAKHICFLLIAYSNIEKRKEERTKK